MVSFFGSKDKAGGGPAANERVPRHSSGWGQLLERMRGEESLRVLDIGPTSSTTINFITALGHSIYLTTRRRCREARLGHRFGRRQSWSIRR